MKFTCMIKGHKIDVCYNQKKPNELFKNIIGCSRCHKVWIWYQSFINPNGILEEKE